MMTVSTKPRERRAWQAQVELRADAAEGRTIDGYAAVFNEWTQIGPVTWGWREKIEPGAFKKTLADGGDVRMLVNHDTNMPLARTKTGTLTLEEDAKGLRSIATPPDVSYANDILELIRTGEVDGMSFGFRVIKDEWTVKPDGSEERVLKELQLIEVSPVTFPAYTQTSVGVRASEIALLSERAGLEEPEARSFAQAFRAVDEQLYVDVITELRDGKPLSRTTREQLEHVQRVFGRLTETREPDPGEPDPAQREDTTPSGTTPLEMAKRRQELLELVAS